MLPSAKKSYGQHFLHDRRVLQRITTLILDSVAIPEAEKGISDGLPLVEVGPGRGALTDGLLPVLGDRLWCIELDPRMYEYLQTTYPTYASHIIQADFLNWQPPAELMQSGFVVAGNFPYNISTQIVFRILEYRLQIPIAMGMFQKEVGKRIASGPGSKEYGILSVLAQSYYDIKYMFDIAPGSFNPPPNVMSGVIMLKRKAVQPDVDYVMLLRVVKACFNQRRKTLRNTLINGGFNVEGVAAALLEKRAEHLDVTAYHALARHFAK